MAMLLSQAAQRIVGLEDVQRAALVMSPAAWRSTLMSSRM